MARDVAIAVDDTQLLEVFDRALAEDLASETHLGALHSIRRGSTCDLSL